MVGENIQKFREQIQSTRGNINILGKLTSPNPGILTKFPAGQRVAERLQNIRGMAMTGKIGGVGTTVSTVGKYDVATNIPAGPSKKFVSV